MPIQLRLASETDIPQLTRLNNQYPADLLYRDESMFLEILTHGFLLVVEDTQSQRLVAMTSARRIAPGYWYHGATVNTLPVSLSHLLFVHSTAEAVRRITDGSRLYGEINRNNRKLSRLLKSAEASHWQLVPGDSFMHTHAYKHSPEPVVFVQFDVSFRHAIISRAARLTTHDDLCDLVVSLPLVEKRTGEDKLSLLG